MLYLLLPVWFLCHGSHPHVIQTGNTESDKSLVGYFNKLLHIPNRTSSQSQQISESVSSFPYRSTNSEQNLATTVGITLNGGERDSFRRTKSADSQENTRQKRTTPYRMDSKDVDFVARRRQLFLAGRDINVDSRDYRRKPKLPSDYMMKIFECFTNSSCEHPHASMVRSFPNKLNTGKHFFKSGVIC